MCSCSFSRARAGAELTVPLSRAALPPHAHQTYGNGLQLGVLMEAGTFAVDPDGAPGSVVLAPGDVRGTRLLPERAAGSCCGLDGAEGPNMACDTCGLPVASRIDDCSLWQAVWLAPGAVRPVLVDDTAAPPATWAELLEEGEGTPPFEPIATWAPGSGRDHFWSWSPRWEAAAGQALAHLLAASEGRPVSVPDGWCEQVFQRALDAMLPGTRPGGLLGARSHLLPANGPGALPADRAVRLAVLAGPGLPVPDAGADIVLVPVHPQTGETWTPDAAVHPVPLPFDVWRWLAFPRPHLALPASGGLPDGVLRDDPPAPRPRSLFRADPGVFRHALARLPAARSPWLREISENLAQYVRAGIF
ncbi:hypothetical protein [Streptomyces bacillaris]|uniref:hypothetical protein n=1 Tax=Streptomyces bacillaris TaxID=68179 RepID=UPI00380F43BB